MNKKNICVVTGSRAEYGLLTPLIKLICADKDVQLQLVVTGMHLSPEFGLTVNQIREDGFEIADEVELLLSSDTECGIAKSTGLGVIGFADCFRRLKPDWVFLLGDRFEILSAAIAAFTARIPIAHLHGGETTEGAIDEAFRHAITKMSYLHFTSLAEYRQRVIQLGESPDRVFQVGAIGLDNITQMNLFSKEELERELNFKIEPPTILVTFHPVTLDSVSSQAQLEELLSVLEERSDLKIIFTQPNADTYGRELIYITEKFVREHHTRAIMVDSLGQKRYLSALKYVDAVVGNSSSGIIEVPSFHKPTVNIGDRQKGRVKASSVIDALPEKASIRDSLAKALSEDFLRECRNVVNPYGNGQTALKIWSTMKQYLTKDVSIKKTFFDVDFEIE